MPSRPTHATAVAYLALFVALGTGGAYAVDRIGSGQVENNSLRSADLKDRRAVAGRDVRRDSLGRKQIRERGLNASQFLPVAGVGDALDCNPTSNTPIDCVTTSFELEGPARVLVIATGGQYTAGGSGGSRAGCDIRIDGGPRPTFASPGELTNGTDAGATNGFARTLVTPDPLPAGTHEFALACRELDPDVRIETPTIAALAISTGS